MPTVCVKTDVQILTRQSNLNRCKHTQRLIDIAKESLGCKR